MQDFVLPNGATLRCVTDPRPGFEGQPLQAANVPAIEAWVETAYAVPEVIPELSPDQFEYLLALTGLEDVWDAVEADLKANNRPAYATLRAQRKKASFAFEVAMGFVEQFAASIPVGVDVSEATIKSLWLDAAAQVL